ncbi:hypothetical protein LNO03_26420 [Klebsiella pneumoniae subsp. pneumoniae]|nr:hypothetical protein [Klebsiella pneumoniae subsp. pneumoniae]
MSQIVNAVTSSTNAKAWLPKGQSDEALLNVSRVILPEEKETHKEMPGYTSPSEIKDERFRRMCEAQGV